MSLPSTARTACRGREYGWVFPYLVRYGPDLARRLLEAFDPYEFGHYLVML